MKQGWRTHWPRPTKRAWVMAGLSLLAAALLTAGWRFRGSNSNGYFMSLFLDGGVGLLVTVGFYLVTGPLESRVTSAEDRIDTVARTVAGIPGLRQTEQLAKVLNEGRAREQKEFARFARDPRAERLASRLRQGYDKGYLSRQVYVTASDAPVRFEFSLDPSDTDVRLTMEGASDNSRRLLSSLRSTQRRGMGDTWRKGRNFSEVMRESAEQVRDAGLIPPPGVLNVDAIWGHLVLTLRRASEQPLPQRRVCEVPNDDWMITDDVFDRGGIVTSGGEWWLGRGELRNAAVVEDAIARADESKRESLRQAIDAARDLKWFER